ncbi:MAG: membrane protein insertase YidC [Flavobacteriaceae bacterium]|nr:membrane protein insertase YidC [Flavobacteriaceae bacterium]
MEERKLDKSSIIGFILIFAIMMFWFYLNQPTPEELEAARAAELVVNQEKSSSQSEAKMNSETAPTVVSDSILNQAYQNVVGLFAFTPKDEGSTFIENDLLRMEISHKGAQIKGLELKQYSDYKEEPVHLIADNNSNLRVNFRTTDNRILKTTDLYFIPSVSKDDKGITRLSMKAKTTETAYLEIVYVLKPDEYLLDYTIKSQNLSTYLVDSDDLNLSWDFKAKRFDQSVMYENRYTRLTYQYNDKKLRKLSASSVFDEDSENKVNWISYRQHFFSSMLVAEQSFDSVDLSSENLVEEESKDEIYTKVYGSKVNLKLMGGELSSVMKLYFGPTDLEVLSAYKDYALADSIPFGWGIFGWINRYIFNPFYSFLASFLPYGMAIIVMTIVVRLAMSPVTYKSYVSQAKMKVLRPEITAINDKYKDNAMKRQQETMKIYNKAGVSPMSGCLPAFLQLPIFYALFSFFPTSFILRQKSFLWVDDLSSYDTIVELPFTIPFYGDHISLFPILASVAIFFYMQMTTGQTMQMQQQPGMPNMKFIMYLSPVMMLFFFNNYASGLSLYYFVSNLLTIGIMLVIKNVILDEEKIHVQIEENKKAPRKENKFQKRMREMMEQAEAQPEYKKRLKK